MSKKLKKAADDLVEATAFIGAFREDLIVKRLIETFTETPFARFDSEALLEELTDIADLAAFDQDGFAIESTDGLKGAVRHRFKLQALRDRLVTLNYKLRSANLKVTRTYRLATVYLRQHERMKGLTVKAQDEIVFGVLREISDVQENIKLVFDSVKEAMSSVDDKTRTIDAWFATHKQYVFMTANRGPQGADEETEAPRRLGSKR